MKVQITDNGSLLSLRPIEVAAYLRSSGWRQVGERGGISSSWAKVSAGDEHEIVLPMRHDLRDFAQRMHDMLRELEESENRSQLEIFGDLLTSSSDKLRIRAIGRETESGTLPLEAGVSYLESAKDVVLAAACSAVYARPNYPTRKPTEATDYLRQVRLGQTERGSFVLTVLCPIPPELQNPPALVPQEPYGRRVTKTLMAALASARDATSHAAITGHFDQFANAVQSGVSANLCDALVRLGEAVPETSLELSLAWSKNRGREGLPPNRATFEPEFLPVLKEAARLFRENEPEQDVQMVGYVVQLKRGEHEAIGKAVVAGLCNGAVRRAVILLPEEQFAVATQAIDNRKPISCRGDLIKVGRGYQLTNPYEFRLLEETTDADDIDIDGFDFEEPV